MEAKFEKLINRLSPVLKRITHRLNGHFTFFDERDLYQEAVEHLWIMLQAGTVEGKTDSYLLQGCFFYLKNYIRKTADKANLVSLNELIDDEDSTLEDLLARDDNALTDSVDWNTLKEIMGKTGLSEREMRVFELLVEGRTVREAGAIMGISHVMVLKIRKALSGKCQKLKNICKHGYQN